MSASSALQEDGAGGEEFPNPLALKSDGALRMYRLLLERCRDKGKVYNQNGEHVGKVAPISGYSGQYPELHFDKPDDFILISRSFPIEGACHDDIQAACTSELTANGIQQNKQNREDMVLFHKELLSILRITLRSKLLLTLNPKIEEQKIKSGETNSICKERGEVYKEYTINPAKENFPKLYDAFFKPFEDGTVIDTAVYDTMQALGLHYASGPEYEALNKTPGKEDTKSTGGSKYKTSTLRALGRSTVRQFRHHFVQKKKLPHGVTMNISESGGRGKNRRKTQQFSWELVKGWGEEKHVEFIKNNGGPAPLPLVGASSVPSVRSGNGRVNLSHNDVPSETKNTTAIAVRNVPPPKVLQGRAANGKKTGTTPSNSYNPPLGTESNQFNGVTVGQKQPALPKTVKEPAGKPGSPKDRHPKQLKERVTPKRNEASAANSPTPPVSAPRAVRSLQNSTGWDSATKNTRGECSGTSPLKKAMLSISKLQSPTKEALELQVSQLQAALMKKEAANRKEKFHMQKLLEEKEKAEKDATMAASDEKANSVARAKKKHEKNISKQTKPSKSKVAKKQATQQGEKATATSDDDDPDDIVQIHKVEADTDDPKKYWVRVTEVKGDKETKEWRDADWVHAFCQLFVDEGNEAVNFLTQFAGEDPTLVPHGFHEFIARKENIDVHTLFPTLGCQPPEDKASPAVQRKQSAKVCGHDHDSANNYKEVSSDYYFLDDRRYSTCKCRNCGKYFDTPCNRENHPEEELIPLPKKGKNLAYACTKFEPGLVLCGNMVCTPCFIVMNSKKRKRRGDTAGEGLSSKKPNA